MTTPTKRSKSKLPNFLKFNQGDFPHRYRFEQLFSTICWRVMAEQAGTS